MTLLIGDLAVEQEPLPDLSDTKDKDRNPMTRPLHPSQKLTFLIIVWFFAVTVSFPGCSSLSEDHLFLSQTDVLQPGDHIFSITHGVRERTYLLHIPPQSVSQQALPLVLNFHGSGSYAQQHQEYTDLDRLADQEGFYVVYPNGTGPTVFRGLTWNAGNCCGYAQEHHVDDVGFIRTLLDDLHRRVPIDRTRVYATGLSNGAMMAYRLAAEASDLIAAIATVAGSMAIPQINPSHPIPIMHVHSLDDPRAPYQGGMGALYPLTKQQVRHFPVEPQLHQWVRQNGCRQRTNKGALLRGTAGTAEAHHTAQKISYHSCPNGAGVILWQLTGAGHVWPGGTPTPFQRFYGPATTLIRMNQEMWNFFVRHQRLPS